MRPILFFLLIVAVTSTATSGSRPHPAELRFPLDALSRSTGGVNPALSVGAGDVFINPGIAKPSSRPELQITTTIDLLAHEYLSMAYTRPLGRRGRFGIALVNRMAGDLERSPAPNVFVRRVGATQRGVALSYGIAVARVSMGVALRTSRYPEAHTPSREEMTATAIDLGMQYRPTANLTLGATLHGPGWFQKRSHDDAGIALGLNWAPRFVSDGLLRILVSGDRHASEPWQFNLGTVVTPLGGASGGKSLSFRAGVGNLDVDGRTTNSVYDYLHDTAPTLTFGTGLTVPLGNEWSLALDYCVQLVEYVSSRHVVTTRLRF